MKKMLTVLCLCLGLLFSLNATTFASTDTSMGAKDVLTKYLEAAINQDTDELVNYVIDKRYSSNDTDFQKKEYAVS